MLGPFAYPVDMKAYAPAPDHPYYLWQIVVQAHHLHNRGIEAIYPIYGEGPGPSALLSSIMTSDLPAHFLYVQDPRSEVEKANGYNASMKPWLMGKVMESYLAPKASELYLYLDPDVVLAGQADPWPTVVSASDTDSYTGPAYLEGKGVLSYLCKLAGVRHSYAKTVPGFGAQYLLRDISAALWFEIAEKSVTAYREMTDHAPRYQPEGDEYPVQAWCSEMYLTQLVFLREGVVPETAGMRFIWANGHLSDWDSVRFFHDAGVIDGRSHFCKIAHQKSPFGHDLLAGVVPDSASRRYVGMIYEAASAYPHLVKEFNRG